MEIKKIKKGQVLCNIQKNTLISFNTVPNKIFKVVENDEYKYNCIDCDIRSLGCCNYVECMASHCHFKLYKNIDNIKTIDNNKVYYCKENDLIKFKSNPAIIYKVVKDKEPFKCALCAIDVLECCDTYRNIHCTEAHCHLEFYKKIKSKEMKEPSKDSDKEYKNGKFECLTTMEDVKGWYYAAIFCASNIFKYSWRLGKKDEALKENAKITDYSNRYKDILERNMKYEYSGKKVAIIDNVDGYVYYFDGKDKHIAEESIFNKTVKLVN